ncbi:MAG TPA: TIGR03067 domain-containing protein [Gemmata sp.]|jgi:uncharacterized protein (TIGR03067 family)|nr:TIGR03067 domain-containing protein [Gemmata sp.]
MRQLIGVAIYLAVALPLIADEKEDAAKKLNGTYEVTAILIEGKPENEKKDKVVFIIKDGTIKVKEGDKPEDEDVKFTVDTTKKPAHIDLTPVKEKDTILGIYELKETEKGAELTIAVGKVKSDRPKDFKGEGKDVMVLKLFSKKDK